MTMSLLGNSLDYRYKNITEEICCLRKFFPRLGSADMSWVKQQLPNGAKGWAAIPCWDAIAPSYGEAVEKVCRLLDRVHGNKFANHYRCAFGPKLLRQLPEKEEQFRKLGEAQKGHDILIVPIQFGDRHIGCSVLQVRDDIHSPEFALGVFEIAIILLTHPEFADCKEVLGIYCAGDEYAPLANYGDFSRVMLFSLGGGKLTLTLCGLDFVGSHIGSATAFLLQERRVSLFRFFGQIPR